MWNTGIYASCVTCPMIHLVVNGVGIGRHMCGYCFCWLASATLLVWWARGSTGRGGCRWRDESLIGCVSHTVV